MPASTRRTPAVVGGLDTNGIERTLRVDEEGRAEIGGVAAVALDKGSDSVTAFSASTTWGTPTQTTAATTNTELYAANASRIGLTINHVSGTDDIGIRFGAPATTSLFHVRLQPGEVYERPSGVTTQSVNIIKLTNNSTTLITHAEGT